MLQVERTGRTTPPPPPPPPPSPPPAQATSSKGAQPTEAQSREAINHVAARAAQTNGSRQADDNNVGRGAQGAAIHAGRTMDKDGRGRAYYNRELKKLDARTDLTGTQARDLRKGIQRETRARLTPFGRNLSEAAANTARRRTQLEGKTEVQLRASAGRSNVFWNRVGAVNRVAGRGLLVVGAATSAYNIASAPAAERGRVIAREAGAWTGALAVGAGGAKVGGLVGLAIGGPVGGAVGAAVGGIGGGIVGAIGGSNVGEKAYNWLFGK